VYDVENVTNIIAPNCMMGIKLDETAIGIPITMNGIPVGYIKNVDDKFIYGAIFNRGLVFEYTEGGLPLEIGVRYDNE
jgi:hypothetical protein